MDLGLLSPHQFTELEPFLDTITVTTYDGSPLDIAIPYQASRLICEALSERLQSRFHGRMTFWTGGDTRIAMPLSEAFLSTIAKLRPHPVKYMLVLTDRTLTQPYQQIQMPGGATCIAADWWQWFRRYVPERRLTDAWMFLCCACPAYRQSGACERVGWPPDVLAAMAEEGEHLFQAFLDDLANPIESAWSNSGRE